MRYTGYQGKERAAPKVRSEEHLRYCLTSVICSPAKVFNFFLPQ